MRPKSPEWVRDTHNVLIRQADIQSLDSYAVRASREAIRRSRTLLAKTADIAALQMARDDRDEPSP